MFSAPLALALVYFTGHPVTAAVAVVAAAMIIDAVIAKDSPSAVYSAPAPSPVAVAVYSAPAQPERPQAPAWPSTLQRQRVLARVSDLNWKRVAFWPGVEVRSPVFKLGAPGLRVALALLLLFTGCGPVEGPYLHTGLDSADTGGPGDDYADVADLPPCDGVWVRLPPTSDDVDRDHDYYPLGEVHGLVYGDPDWSGPPALVYPVVYRTFAQDDQAVGWTVGGDAVLSDLWWAVVYQPFPDWSADTQPFALACG